MGPQATFSPCFGEPFLPLPPEQYAELLAARIEAHQPSLWLVNTGWTGGSFGTGERISIAHTRALVRAINEGELLDVETSPEPVFGLAVPVRVPGVPDEVLRPRDAWADTPAYDVAAAKLRKAFRDRAREQGIAGTWTG